MPDNVVCLIQMTKDLSANERPISYQLVGEVTAHQGDDGVAGLRGWPATSGLRHCPDLHGGLQ